MLKEVDNLRLIIQPNMTMTEVTHAAELLKASDDLQKDHIGTDFIITDDIGHVPLFNFPHKLDSVVISIFSEGCIEGSCDLKPLRVEAPCLSILFPDQIVEYHQSDNRVKATLLIMSAGFAEPLKFDRSYSAFFRFKEHPRLPLTPSELNLTLDFCRLLKDTVKMNDHSGRGKIIAHLFQAFFFMVSHFEHYSPGEPVRQTRQEELFERFYKEVILHHKESRELTFYADRLCITPKYLGRLIKQTSGKTANEWINDYVVLEAKSMLRYRRELSLEDISDTLGFPNASFFGTFFRQHTGYTPRSYRNL